MKLRKRFVAWFLTGVMAVSSVQFPVSYVHAEEIQTDEVSVEINEKEAENAGMESESEKEHEPNVTGEQKEFSEEEHEETIVVDKAVESDEQEREDRTGSDIVEVQEDVEESSTVILSGNCGENGDNVTFVLDSEGIMTINGSGRMDSYLENANIGISIGISGSNGTISCSISSNQFRNQPWYDERNKIKTVIIDNGITSIGRAAFSGCSSLTSVNIPESVTSIETAAFYGCNSLTSVNIPESVTNIETAAFYGCSRLTGVNIPESVTNIETAAFYGCSRLTNVDIPESVMSIGIAAFGGNSRLTSINIPESVTSIGEYAFSGCSRLANVNIPESVMSIGEYAFSGCSSLTSVNIPENVTSIGKWMFGRCSGLTSVNIPESVMSIGEYAFNGCSSLTSINIPESVTSIEKYVFDGCSSLTSVNIPESVMSIGEYAFRGCSSLTSVNIPDGVASIGDFAFDRCSSLQDVYYGGSEEDWEDIAIGGGNDYIEKAVIHYNSTVTSMSLSNADIKLSQESYTYDGLAKKPSVYVTLNGKTLTKDVDYTVSYSNNINVGTATVTITGIGNYTDSVIRKFIIEEKTVEKKEISLGDYIYLGSYYDQPILWRCVDKDENGLLMLSDRILCFKAYDACGEDDYYHNDSWGYIRKQSGSNCWEDSSIRQWLNSNSDTVTYSHCPPSAERVYDGYNPYDTEFGFLNNFSADDQNCIKQITQVINVNAYEADRDGYCDGGSEEIDCRSIYDYPLDTDYTKFFYKRCSDKIFLMNARQIRRVYNNFDDYIYAYPTEDAVQNNDEKSSEITTSTICPYRLNVPGTLGASFEHVETVPANQLNPKGAYQSSGIRPAFYLNESLFSGEVFKEKPSNNNTIVNAAVELSQESYIYDGLAKKPSVRVILNGKTLTQNVDYTVTYSNNINVGIATVTITGIGNYTGIVIKEFTIEEIKTSGSCGDDLTWKISGANNKLILTISGTGTMTDYSSLDEVPWHNRASSIISLVIEDGVASIGDNAFADFTAIKNVEIPESVTTIGYSAFANMDNVEGLIITDGVTSIGDRSFYSCDKLAYVEIAGSVTSVGSSAFNDCGSLKEVVFCGDAPAIGADCFSNTSDLSIYYPETAVGWNSTIQQSYDLCKWQKWDNTVPTRDIVLLLDVSGSMEGKTDKLKVAVNSFIDAMGGRLKNTRVALVPYNSSASVLSGLTTNKEYLALLVNGLTANGGTSYSKALNSADALLTSSNARQKAIVMFSDGEPEDSKPNIYALSEKLRESYVIYTVGLVDSSSYSDVLKKVAGNDGRYFEADNIDGLIDAFLNLADEIDSAVKDFSIDETAIGSVNGMVRISGSISLTDDSKLSAAVLESKIKSIQWTSSDQNIVQDSEISCLGINSYDNRSAELMISFTPHKEGKVTITGTTSNGLTGSCEVTINDTNELVPANPVHHCIKDNGDIDTTDWSYVYFGSYPQSEVTGKELTSEIIEATYDANGDAWVKDNKYRRISKSDTNYNGYFGNSKYRYFKWEQIKWRVMNNDGSTLFVVADLGIDCKGIENLNITWEKCTLRDWMNNTFYAMAFDSREQEAIIEQNVVNNDSPSGDDGGNDTKDNIYLLSFEETCTLAYGFCDKGAFDTALRQISDYAHTMGSWRNDEEQSWYRLRTNDWIMHPNDFPMGSNDRYTYSGNGWFYNSDGTVSDISIRSGTVVPVLHIDLSSDCWSLADDRDKEEEPTISDPVERRVRLTYRSDGKVGTPYDGSKSVNATHYFYYSDDFFYKDSTKYNNSLAVLTLGLELTAFSSPKYEEQYTSVLEKDERAENIKDAYDKLGFNNDKYYNYKTPLSDASNKVAFSFATKKISDGQSEDTLVAVVVRGGGYGAEWVSNFHVGNSGNATGFDTAAKEVLSELEHYIQSIDIKGNLKLWITGYSRGGAVANILTHYINENRSGVYSSLQKNNIFAYTFATPSGYREDASNNIDDGNLWNIVGANDIVPKLALVRWGFSKYGNTRVLPEYSSAALKKNYKNFTGKDFDLYYANRAEEAITNVLYDVTGGTDIWSLKFENLVMSGLKAKYTESAFDQVTFVNDVINIIDNIIHTDGGKYKLIYALSCIVGEELAYVIDLEQDEPSIWHVIKNMIDAHYPEYYLCWLEGGSSILFKDDLYAWISQDGRDAIDITVENLFNETYLQYSFFCPVDVNVYNSNGTLVASIISNEVIVEELPCYVNGDEKVVYLTGDDTYRFELIGNDTGTMDYIVNEYNHSSEVVRSVYYYDVPLEKGLIYTDTVDNTILNDQEDYSITDGKNQTVPALDTLTGSTAEYKITVENGISIQSSAVKGESVSIIPIVEKGYEFVQWTSSESTDIFSDVMAESTRFCMPGNDVIITAILKKVDSSEKDDNIDGVLPEDIPTDGKIPNGLWIAGVKDYTYTGQAIKPEVRVYDSETRLKAGQDYVISYKNNTKANNASDVRKAPTIIVKGKGNYSGTETATFKILPLDLNDSSISAADITTNYNQKTQKKVPAVMYNGKKLTNKKDFTVSYPDTQNNPEAYKAVGTYNVILTAANNSNFIGTRTVNLVITNKILISKATIKKIPDQPYTTAKDAIRPELTVTMKNIPLTKGKDYEVEYLNNTEIGVATALITGIGDYAGTKTATFKITGTSLQKAQVSGITSKTYTGAAQEQNMTVTLNGRKLAEGTDYAVVYSNNKKAGNASLTIKGINSYSGSLKKTFKIVPYDLGKDEGKLLGGLQGNFTAKYTKGGGKPRLEVTFNGNKLVEGTDYSITYKNNKAVTIVGAGKSPTFTLKGKGNFKGSLSKTFVITSKALNDAEFPVAMVAKDIAYVDKAGKYISNPILTDVDGTKLTAGKDYVVAPYTLEDGTVLTKQSKVGVNTNIKVKVLGTGAYTGELEAVYRITPKDFSKAKVSIPTQTYTGRAVTLDNVDITVKVGNTILTRDVDYEIVKGSYANNVKKGTATVTIVGKGNYGGTKTVKFKIAAKKLVWFQWLFG